MLDFTCILTRLMKCFWGFFKLIFYVVNFFHHVHSFITNTFVGLSRRQRMGCVQFGIPCRRTDQNSKVAFYIIFICCLCFEIERFCDFVHADCQWFSEQCTWTKHMIIFLSLFFIRYLLPNAWCHCWESSTFCGEPREWNTSWQLCGKIKCLILEACAAFLVCLQSCHVLWFIHVPIRLGH